MDGYALKGQQQVSGMPVGGYAQQQYDTASAAKIDVETPFHRLHGASLNLSAAEEHLRVIVDKLVGEMPPTPVAGNQTGVISRSGIFGAMDSTSAEMSALADAIHRHCERLSRFVP